MTKKAEDKALDNDRYNQTRRMILIRVLLLPFIILMLVCGSLVYYFGVYSRDQVKAKLVRIADGHRRFIEQFLRERTSDLRFATSINSLEKLSAEGNLAELFRDLQLKSHAFFDLGVFDEKGNHLAYVGPYNLIGKNYSDTKWFKTVQERGLYISNMFLGYRNIPHFIIVIRCDEGEMIWYLRATIDTLLFNDLVESIHVGKTGEAYLVNRKGILQTRRRFEGKPMERDQDYHHYIIDEEKITSFSAGEYTKQRYLYAAGALKNTDWVFVVRQEIGDAYGPLARACLVAVALIIGGGALVVIMAYVLASNLANQLTLADMEKRQIKTQLIIAGKLAEVGEMSAGLAHEINNPLQVMKSEQALIEEIISDMGKREVPPDRESMRLLKDSVEQINIQIERCKQITAGLLRFARKADTPKQEIKIQELLPEIVSMIEKRALVENIRIIQELDPDLPPVIGDPNQLQQVFLNLLNNAIHALRGKDIGEIRIKALQENSCLIISTADNGRGIPPENMEKIFLPFFTTKPPGQGTGLGLSTAYGIVKGMGGEITVTSEEDVGTVFTIRLPIKSPENGKNMR